jgi:hypothetical protein
MKKVEEYREHARRCELMLEKADDPRVRQQLRRERQEWLDLAASREAALRNERWGCDRPLDEDMTLSSLRAYEASRAKSVADRPPSDPEPRERPQETPRPNERRPGS